MPDLLKRLTTRSAAVPIAPRVLLGLPVTILALAGGLTSGCGDPAGSMAATLMVTAATTGADPDPDGFAVVLDGHAGRPLGRNATLTLVDLEPGEHRVAL